MLRFLKYAVLLALMLIVLPAGYVAGPFLTQVTTENIEGRLHRACMVGAFVQVWQRRLPSTRNGRTWRFSDCACLAASTVQSLGAPLASQIGEAARQSVIAGLTGGRANADPARFHRFDAELMGRSLEAALKICHPSAVRI